MHRARRRAARHGGRGPPWWRAKSG